MTRIIIEAISPDKMRLPEYREEGCGDWFADADGDTHIQVAFNSDVWDDPEAFAIAIHELTEARLAFASGVTQGAVDRFDALFERERASGMHGPHAEPGCDPRAPYRKEHADAMIIEGLIRRFLGVDPCAA